MSRVLRVARATVAPGREPEYARLLGELGRVVRQRGARFWVFRSTGHPGRFLEFREASDARLLDPDREESAIRQSLDGVVVYDAGADDHWNEFAP